MNTIQAAWAKFREDSIPADVPELLVERARDAFYAGAIGLFMIVEQVGDATLSTDAALAVLDGLHSELADYAAGVLNASGQCQRCEGCAFKEAVQ